MKILHTSDWHLGAELEGHSRADEHQHFLDWLLETMSERETEVLLMAGDIFHHSHPSAAAQRMFYEFVTKLEAIPTLRHAVFIGGNHDSPSRLEAPGPLLHGRKMTLIGGYNNQMDEERMLVPIKGDSGEVELVVVAAPYVHEQRLRVSSMGKDSEELRTATVDAFESFYRRLGELAKKRWPEADIVGMGHLTSGNPSEDDYGTALHNVGTIDALPSTIFCPDIYNYVALGHIHRGYRVDQSCANYSGSPLTFRFNASELSERRVVEVDGKTGEYKRIAIPLVRHLVELKGERADLEARLKAFESTSELPTWVNIVLEIDDVMLEPVVHFRALARENVFVIMAQQRRLTRGEPAPDRADLPDVRQMSPKEIFVELFKYQNEGGLPSARLLQKFDQAAHTVVAGEHE